MTGLLHGPPCPRCMATAIDHGEPFTVVSHVLPLSSVRDVPDTTRIVLHGTFGERTLNAIPGLAWIRLTPSADWKAPEEKVLQVKAGVTAWLRSSPNAYLIWVTGEADRPAPPSIRIEIGGWNEPDVRPIKADWGALIGLIDGAKQRGYDARTIEYIEQSLALAWAKATHAERQKHGREG